MSAMFPEPPLARVSRVLGRWEGALFRFREEAAYLQATALVLGFAILTGLSAQVSIPLPFTPVPVTGQVFAVLVSATLLGRKLGPLSQVAYVGLGFLGVPWFAATTGGPLFSVGGAAVVLGATGGYLLGFIAAAALIGWFVDRARSRSTFSGILAVELTGVGVIYAFGALQLAVILGLAPQTALDLGVLPFLPVDMLKCVLVASLLAGSGPLVRAGAVDRSPTGAAVLRTRDLGAFVALLTAVWVMAAYIALDGGAPYLLEAWYMIAAGTCTAAAVVALAWRVRFGRGMPSPGGAPE